MQIQETMKAAGQSLGHSLLRFVSGFFIGITLGLVVKELLSAGVFVFLFAAVVITAALYKVLARYTITQILVFDLICVLVGMLLRMYILIAPG